MCLHDVKSWRQGNDTKGQLTLRWTPGVLEAPELPDADSGLRGAGGRVIPQGWASSGQLEAGQALLPQPLAGTSVPTQAQHHVTTPDQVSGLTGLRGQGQGQM